MDNRVEVWIDLRKLTINRQICWIYKLEPEDTWDWLFPLLIIKLLVLFGGEIFGDRIGDTPSDGLEGIGMGAVVEDGLMT